LNPESQTLNLTP